MKKLPIGVKEWLDAERAIIAHELEEHGCTCSWDECCREDNMLAIARDLRRRIASDR